MFNGGMISEEQKPSPKQSASIDTQTEIQNQTNRDLITSDAKLPLKISKTNIGNGSITYIDIYPLLSNLQKGKISTIDFSSVLGNISEILPSEKLDSKPINLKDLSIMRELDGDGNIRINTSSLLFLDNKIDSIKVNQSSNNGSSEISNITQLSVLNYTSTLINAPTNHFSISDGNGLYSKILLEQKNTTDDSNPYSTKYSFDTPTILEGISNGKAFTIFNVTAFEILQQPVLLYAFQPQIEAHGISTIKEYYFFKHLVNPNHENKEIIVNGTVEFKIYMSDYYSLISNVSIKGVISGIKSYGIMDSLNPVINKLNLFSTPIIVWMLLLLPALLVIISVRLRAKVQDI
jgi:hypothetical protein